MAPPRPGCCAPDELHGAITLLDGRVAGQGNRTIGVNDFAPVDDLRAIADAERDLDVVLDEQHGSPCFFNCPNNSTMSSTRTGMARCGAPPARVHVSTVKAFSEKNRTCTAGAPQELPVRSFACYLSFDHLYCGEYHYS
jgi:hypothetical protein